MEQTTNYKDDVIATRVGCLGSSDGKILAQTATLGYVPRSAYNRLAVCKGLIQQTEIPQTDAVKAGDAIEQAIFQHLSSRDPRYQSNPLWVSKRYSHRNVKLITHPDIVMQDDANKVLNIYEVKTTKFTFEQTRTTYQDQLYIHYTIGMERAKELGSNWQVKVFLVHYSTDGLDLSDGVEFDPSRMTVRQVYASTASFDVALAMNIIDQFLDKLTEYYQGEEIDADFLPDNVRNQMTDMAVMLSEIKQREARVDEFKKKLYAFMSEHLIKSIKNDYFSISCIAPTESKQFDSKRYLADLKKKHPRKSKKIIDEYTKTVKRSGYASIKVRDDK